MLNLAYFKKNINDSIVYSFLNTQFQLRSALLKVTKSVKKQKKPIPKNRNGGVFKHEKNVFVSKKATGGTINGHIVENITLLRVQREACFWMYTIPQSGSFNNVWQ